MRFMNEWEIEDAVTRYAGHHILGPAARTLHNLMDAANRNSDGWAFWPKPARAAARLMALFAQDGVSRAELVAAYRPIKAFRTRSGLAFEIEEVPR